MQLLTRLHNTAEQEHQAIGRDWGCHDILGGTTTLADSRDQRRAGLQQHWRAAIWHCVFMNHHNYTHRHHAAPAHLPAVPLPAQEASLLPELRAWARLCLTTVAPLMALVQTLSQEEKAKLTTHSALFQCAVTGTAVFLLSQAGEDRLQSLYS